jgi:hypothetical protein
LDSHARQFEAQRQDDLAGRNAVAGLEEVTWRGRGGEIPADSHRWMPPSTSHLRGYRKGLQRAWGYESNTQKAINRYGLWL